jgi:hypothetical protein
MEILSVGMDVAKTAILNLVFYVTSLQANLAVKSFLQPLESLQLLKQTSTL